MARPAGETAVPVIMIIGLGELGGRLLSALGSTPHVHLRIVVVSRDPAKAQLKINAALFAGSYLGCFPVVEHTALDVAETDRLAELIAGVQPVVIVNTASRSPWWARELLPERVRERLETVGAGPGLWSAGHLSIVRHLVTAMARAGCQAPLVNAAYPDVVNPALAPIARGPLIGVGNIDLLTPPVRYLVARDLRTSAAQVSVILVAHNFHASRILRGQALGGVCPWLKVEVDGEVVTDCIDQKNLWSRLPLDVPIPLGSGAAAVAVGSLLRTVMAIVTGEEARGHAPGVAGLPGGYPVTIGPSGAVLALPPELQLSAAVEVNRTAQRAEGVQEIEADGTIVFTETARAVLAEVFNLEAERVSLDEAEAFAGELLDRFSSLARRYGIHLPELSGEAPRLKVLQ
jgi:hypothetical protein